MFLLFVREKNNGKYGCLGLIPPILTITLAFVTKDVIIALFLGILWIFNRCWW